MGKEVGSEPLGHLYSDGKVRRRREWRGVRDTLYDYSRWLRNWGVLIAFVAKPRNIKGFFRYRWMVNYLAVPMMMDRMTEGLRGPHLRIAHLEYGLIIQEIAATIEKLDKHTSIVDVIEVFMAFSKWLQFQAEFDEDITPELLKTINKYHNQYINYLMQNKLINK